MGDGEKRKAMKKQLKEEHDKLWRVLDGMEAFNSRPVRNRPINRMLKRLEELRAELVHPKGS